METLGCRLRRQRRRLGLTLNELAGRTGISKPYLSLIETGRVANPPSDEKLRQLEKSLGFTSGELVGPAHLQRTPHDIRAMLTWLLAQRTKTNGQPVAQTTQQIAGQAVAAAPRHAGLLAAGIDLDDAFISGVLQELADQQSSNIEPVTTQAVPVINCQIIALQSILADLATMLARIQSGPFQPSVKLPDAVERTSEAAIRLRAILAEWDEKPPVSQNTSSLSDGVG